MASSTKKQKTATRIILVTGGTGLVGRAIQSVIEQEQQEKKTHNETWIFLGSKDGDLRDATQVKALFEKHKPTHVLHLAATVGGLFKNMKMPVEFWHDNVSMDDNIMKCAHQFKVEKMVSCLSTCVFPDKTEYPIDETMIHNGPPHFSNEAYAYAKRMIDVLNRAYHKEYGCQFTSVIPTNIYGANDNYNLEDAHVIPGLIHKCYIAKKEKKPFVAFGSGKPLRQFIYSTDLAKLFVWVLREYHDIDPIILSVPADMEVSIADVVKHIAKAMDFTGEIKWDTSKADGQFKKTASNAKLAKLLAKTYPDFKFTSMEQGIRESVKWFVENFDKARK